ncbi:MAG: hypothetical protein Q8N79_04285 [Candidatus Methanoperedens sp.]|nr:hypothetical protein [Candidatus Methanoperedens sp.]
MLAIDDDTFLDFYEEPKVIEGDLIWKHVGEGRLAIKDVNIISNILPDKEIKLFCKQNIYNDFAFIIVYYGEERKELVKYDKRPHPPSFIDKCTKIPIREPHKHKFKEGYPNGCRYIIPNDEIDRVDVNKAIFQFLKECNILLLGEYEKLSPLRYQSLLHDFSNMGGTKT